MSMADTMNYTPFGDKKLNEAKMAHTPPDNVNRQVYKLLVNYLLRQVFMAACLHALEFPTLRQYNI